LGNSFDIHGGGSDLIFPHHENECAQSLCAHPNDTYARYWVHAGMLMVDGVKMSKSLGNFHTVKEIVSQYPAEALRLLFISSHYHQPFNFTFDGLKQAKQVLDKFYNALLKNVDVPAVAVAPDEKVMDALTDDINTPLAISRLHEIVNDLNKAETFEDKQKYKSLLLSSAKIMGLLYQSPELWFKSGNSVDGGLSDEEINSLIAERAEAKKAKNWAVADEIRNKLKAQGILLEDTPNGTCWKRE
jgi:cysteinyl-tRNA synthetase